MSLSSDTQNLILRIGGRNYSARVTVTSCDIHTESFDLLLFNEHGHRRTVVCLKCAESLLNNLEEELQ